MSRLKWLVLVVLCAGMFFSSGVFADRITIGSETVSATIDGEYGEEGVGAYGVYVEYSPLIYVVNLTFTEDAEGYISASDISAYAYGVYTPRKINNIIHDGSLEVVATGDDAYSTGIYGDYTNLTSLNNSGDITAEATGDEEAYAYGVHIRGGASDGNINSLTNSGNITATATQTGMPDELGSGEVGALFYYYDYDVVAFGVLAESSANSGYGDVESSGGNICSLENSGNIKAEATLENKEVYAAGVQAFSEAISYGTGMSAISSGGNIYNLTNSGDITCPFFSSTCLLST
ncbi:MAG: hypothetical protein N3D17_07650, partial [bacterium]|nr:hypothetical protein [bacterium]